MEWLVNEVMCRRLLHEVVGEWRNVQKASIWGGW